VRRDGRAHDVAGAIPAFRAAQMRLEATTLRRRETGFDAAKVKLVTLRRS